MKAFPDASGRPFFFYDRASAIGACPGLSRSIRVFGRWLACILIAF
jgi:hypothetical protein